MIHVIVRTFELNFCIATRYAKKDLNLPIQPR